MQLDLRHTFCLPEASSKPSNDQRRYLWLGAKQSNMNTLLCIEKSHGGGGGETRVCFAKQPPLHNLNKNCKSLVNKHLGLRTLKPIFFPHEKSCVEAITTKKKRTVCLKIIEITEMEFLGTEGFVALRASLPRPN